MTRRAITGKLTGDAARATMLELRSLLPKTDELVLDLEAVEEIDSAGAAVLAAFVRQARQDGTRCRIVAMSPSVASTLELLPSVTSKNAATADERTGFLLRLGEDGAALLGFLGALVLLCADVAWFCAAALLRPRSIRWRVVAYEMSLMGSRALGVVGLIAFLVGGTMALQAAAQLRQFGANIFVVDLVAVSITRELGPLMTAVVVAGRSGSAVAAELGTMVINEEVDALRTMGIQPVRFLIVPKVLAITAVQPLLTMLANALAIGGGMLVAVTYLDVGISPFAARLQEALLLRDLLTGLFKSVLFANLIVTIGAVFGMQTRGGADAVGRNTTASVVASIFAVVVADALCSLLFYFGG